MKMSSFEYQMTKLDHLVLITDAANTRLVTQRLHRLELINNRRPPPEVTSTEDHDLLLDNVPI